MSPLSHQRAAGPSPGQASRGCSPAAKPLYTAGEPTISFRHHGSHLHSLPPVPMEVEGGRFVGCSVGIEDKPVGGRAHGLAERLLADRSCDGSTRRLFVRDRRAGWQATPASDRRYRVACLLQASPSRPEGHLWSASPLPRLCCPQRRSLGLIDDLHAGIIWTVATLKGSVVTTAVASCPN